MVEEARKLFGMHLEVILIVLETYGPDLTHSLLDSA
jgi:hypothetical protein